MCPLCSSTAAPVLVPGPSGTLVDQCAECGATIVQGDEALEAAIRRHPAGKQLRAEEVDPLGLDDLFLQDRARWAR